MTFIKKTLAIFIVAAIALSLTACDTSKIDIRKLMNRFEESCHELDTEEMLDCINPKVADAIETAAGLVGLFTSKSSEEIIQSLANILFDNSLFGTSDFFTTVEIKINTVDVTGNEATGTATVTYSSDGVEQNKPATFRCIRENEVWYISKLSIDM